MDREPIAFIQGRRVCLSEMRVYSFKPGHTKQNDRRCKCALNLVRYDNAAVPGDEMAAFSYSLFGYFDYCDGIVSFSY